MVNNVGTITNKLLNTALGEVTTPALVSADISIRTGELGNGCLLFDSSGTLGVVSNYSDENNFTVTTYARSIDIQTILTQSY